jgi:hypothetical protein
MTETKFGLLTATVGLSSAIIGVVGTIVVGSFGYFNKDRELDIQMVNVGLSILRGEVTGNEDTYQARRFALRLLKKYAAVEIPDNEFNDWAQTGTTPFRRTYSVPQKLSDEELLALDLDELQHSIEQSIARLQTHKLSMQIS